jgi:DTW domain-containing protein YfiP
LSELGTIERSNLFLREIDLVVFVIDGTWSTAKKTMLHCETLAPLPRISFDVTTPSQIRIRQQPAPHCITTAEAIHQTIEILGPSRGFDISTRTHDVLLHTQEAMVSKQVALAKRHYPAYWG